MRAEMNHEELVCALRALRLSPDEARLCDVQTAAAVTERAIEAFVSDGDARWWWASLKVPARVADYPEGDGYQHLREYVPPGEERCWLIVENDLDGPWHVLNVNIEVIPDLIGECHAFEYYLIGLEFDWLVCENHHNQVVAATTPRA